MIQASYPSLDLTSYSAAESLLVDGNALVQANLVTAINTAFLRSNLKAISEGTFEVEDSELDALMTSYFVTRYKDAPAKGQLCVVVQNDVPLSITKTTQFTYNGITFTSDVDTVFQVSTSSSSPRLERVYDAETSYSYRAVFAVTATTSGLGGNAPDGASFSIVNSFNGFGRAFANTAFSGGSTAETNQELAKRALSGMSAKTLGGGQTQTNSLVKTLLPSASSGSVGVNHPCMTRNRNNALALPLGGYTDIYLKSGLLSSKTFQVSATVTNQTTRTCEISLTREQSSGVYRFKVVPYTSSLSTYDTGDLSQGTAVYSPWLSGVFSPSVQNGDLPFSANTTVVITFTDTRANGVTPLVPMTNGQVISNQYGVYIEYMPNLLSLADSLYSDSYRPSGYDILLKAAVPCKLNVTVTAVRPQGYTGSSESVLRTAIINAINSLDVGVPIDSSYIIGVVSRTEPTLTNISVNLVGTVYGQNGSNLSLIGSVAIPTNTTLKVTQSISFYSPDTVVVSLV
jgi:hypothetical protein